MAEKDSNTGSIKMTTKRKISSKDKGKYVEDLSLTLLNKWDTKSDNYISALHPSSDKQAWISTGDTAKVTDKILLVNETGKIEKSKTLDVNIKDFCVHPVSGDIWFCCHGDNSTESASSIIKFKTEGEPLSICMSCDDNLLVGIKEKIVKFSQEGKIICETKAVDEVPLVRYPSRIKQCPITKNIAVVDLDLEPEDQKEQNNYIALFKEDLQLFKKYNGERPEELDDEFGMYKGQFLPVDVCFNNQGYIFICEAFTKSIICINGNCEFIQTVYMETNVVAQNMAVAANGCYWAVFKDHSENLSIAVMQ